MNFFKKLFSQNRVKANQHHRENSQTFILEPILTPSALIDIETGEETPNLDSELLADIAPSNPEELERTEESLSEERNPLENPLEVEETVDEIEEELPFFTSLTESISREEVEGELNLESDPLEPEELSLPSEVRDSIEPEVETATTLPEISSVEEELSPTETEQSAAEITDDALLSEDREAEQESEENLGSDRIAQVAEARVEPEYLDVERGYFRVGESGLLQVNFILDGGKYSGEIGLFSWREMGEFELDSPEFITEAAQRVLSDSDWGQIAISDRTEGALLDEKVESRNWNSGQYQGEKTLTFQPGDRLGIMLVPKGSIQQVLNNPQATGARAPLFSLEGTALVKIGEDSCGYGFEDIALDRKSDRDYNDIIFTLKGATPVGISPIENLIDADANWQETEAGERILEELKCPHAADEKAPMVETQLLNDSGLSSSDRITNDPSISGSVTDESAIEQLQISFDGTNFSGIGAELEEDGSFSLDKETLNTLNGKTLTDGEHTLSVQATDEYGNTSEITDISFTLDTSAPEIQLNLEAQTELEEINLTGETEPNLEVTLTQTGATITSDENGAFTFEGVALELGENSFTVETEDIAGNTGTTTQSITRLEAPVNQSPFFTTEPDLEAIIGQSYQTPLSATDPDGDELTYEILSAPEGMQLGADGASLEWSPESEAEGNHSVLVRVEDGRGGSDELQFTLAAIEQPANRPPEVSSIPVVDGNVNQDYEYQVVASDPDGDNLTYSVTAPEGLEIDSAGKITWTPSNEQVGLHEVIVGVSDGEGGEVEQHYSILVQPEVGNSPPVIISEPAKEFGLLSEDQSETRTVSVVVRDFSYEHSNFQGSGPWGVYQGIVNNELDSEGKPTLNNGYGYITASQFSEWYRDVPGVNLSTTIPLTLRETSAGSGVFGFSDSSYFPIDNQLFGNEGYSYNYHFTTEIHTDFTYTGGEAFQFRGDDDVWVFINNQLVVDLGGVHGPAYGEVNLDDLDLMVGETYSIDVFHAERQTRGSTFQMQTSLDLEPNRQFTYQINATDAEDGDFSFRLLESPNGMKIDPETGLITWNPSLSQTGSHWVEVAASDEHGGIARQRFELEIAVSDPSEIRGTVFQDSDGDGIKEEFELEPGVPGWVVYLDENHNQERDLNEIFTRTDSEGNYTFSGLPSGMYVLGIEPQEEWNETTLTQAILLGSSVTLDDIDFAVRDVSQINTSNRPPEFTNSAPATASVGSLWRYDATATDPDNDNLSYFLSVGPEGMSVDPQTGTFVWTPTLEQAEQPHSVILGVDDSNGGIDLKAFQVNTQVEHPPVVTSEPPSTPLNAGTPYEYQVQATDPNLDALTFSVETDQPGITIDDNGLLNLETPVTGVHEVIITVEDGQGESATQTLTLEVVENAENTPPRLLSEPRTTATIGQPYIAQVQAIDDNGDKLAYSLDAPDQLGLSIDQNGQIYWTPTQAEHLGTHEITLTVNDGRGGEDSQTFNLTVSNQSQNQRPEITATPPNSATLGTQYRYQMQGSDPDGDLLLWSLDQAPSGMSIHSTTGEITWTPTAEQLGEQEVAVRLTDSQGSYTGVIFTLTARGTNIAPLVVSTPLTETSIGGQYLYQVLAEDPDGDALTFSLDQAPAGMEINQHGVITWTPTATGSEPISVLVTDSLGATTTHSYTLEVEANARNLAPTITSTPETYGTTPGLEYTYQLSALDPEEGENVTYQLLSGPENLILDPQTGQLQWTPTPSQAGSHFVQVAAVDSQGLSGGQGFYLNVRDNSAPVIVSAPNTELFEGQTFRYNLRAIDPDGDHLSYQLSQAPEGMTIDGQGRIIWDAREGTYDSIEATVTDEYGATVTQSIPLQVSLDEENPQVSLFQSFDFAYPNQEVLFAVQGSDNLGIAEKGLTINGTPVPLDAWGSATWTFTAPGVYQIGATVMDKSGNETTETFEFTVAPVPGDEVIDFNLNLPEGEISEATELLGEISAPEGLKSYKVEVAPLGTDEFITLFEKQGEVENGVLGTFDLTLLANGAYTLRVSAIDNNDFESYTQTQVEVSSELKLGNFQLSFTDLEIPVTGIPISVTRTYDSLYAHEQDNFGQGWRLEFRDTNLQTSVRPPDEEQQLLGYHNGFKQGEKVYITLPGGKRETFTFSPIPDRLNRFVTSPNGQGGWFRPQFTSPSGSGLTLRVEDVRLTRNTNGEYVALNGLKYNPEHYSFGSKYTLTTDEGIEYEIDARSGDLLQVKDLNGNTLNYSDAGIVSSTGVEVKFERDSQGRIAKVIDPAGEEIQYNYDENGDLISVVDREGNETQYYYEHEERPHYLTRIEDLLGREGIRVEYGEDGRLSRTIDVNGEAVELVYDTEGQTQVVKDLYGKETFYAYDQNGNITQEIQPSGLQIQRTYDRHLVETETVYTDESPPEGWTTTYTYDTNGNLLTETDPQGNVTRYTYGRDNRLLSETDALGNTTTYEYDSRGNLTSSTDALGNTTEYQYDSRGNLRILTDAKDNNTRFYYDWRGNVTQVIDAEGNVTEYEYDSYGNRTLERRKDVTQPDGSKKDIISYWHYDSEGRVLFYTDPERIDPNDVANPDNATTTYEYDANGNQIKVTDVRGNISESVYDNKGQLVASLYQGEVEYVTLYDKGGRERASIDESGVITHYRYDSAGQLVETVYGDTVELETFLEEMELADGYQPQAYTLDAIDWTKVLYPVDRPPYLDNPILPRTSTRYSQDGRVLAEIDENQNKTEYKYNELGQLTQVIYPEVEGNSSITTYDYDSAGRRIKETDAKGNITSYQYDKLGRAHKVIFADDTFSQTQFDTLGRRVKSIDQQGIITQYKYDNLGRLTTVVQTVTVDEEKKEIKTQYRYDEIGRLIEVEDANHHITKYEYDLAGRRVAVILPEGQRSQSTYDDLGNIETYTDFNKEVTDYDYDDHNRLEKKDLEDDTDIEYTYTDDGQIETITDSRGTTTFGYDELGYLRSRQDPEGPYLESGNTIEYDYDDMGNIVEVRTPSGTVEYKYDSHNRLHEVIEGDEKTVYRYDEVGNLVRTEFPNQTVETRTYDELYRLTNVQVVDKNEEILAQFDYELNDAGHRVQVTEKLRDSDGELIERTVDYDYDELYRLIEAAVWGGETITYGYDDAGNRTEAGEITYVYDDNDRLIQEKQGSEIRVEYKYDDNGNLIERRQQGTPTVEYVWDDQNRLVKVVEYGQVVEYEYDDDNIRVSQTVGGQKTSFLLDKNRPYDQVLAEFVDGEEVASYVYGLDLISQQRNGDDSFYFVDGLGSTRGLTDSSGEVTDAYWYDAYGNLLEHEGNSGNDYLFAGEQFDEGLGQYYLRQRYYDPATGRFTRRDTWEGDRFKPITLHKYLYGNGNPVRYIDPSGLASVDAGDEIAAIIELYFWMEDPLRRNAEHKITRIWQNIDIKSQDIPTRVVSASQRRKITDLVDYRNNEIYEIGTFKEYEIKREKMDNVYLPAINNALSHLGRNPAWKGGERFIPPSPVVTPMGDIAIVRPPIQGVISYQILFDGYATATIAGLMYTLAQAQAKYLESQIKTSISLTRGFL